MRGSRSAISREIEKRRMLDIDRAATVCECLLRHRDQGQDSKGTGRVRSGIHRTHLSGILRAVTKGLRDHLQSRTQGKLFHCVLLAMRLKEPDTFANGGFRTGQDPDSCSMSYGRCTHRGRNRRFGRHLRFMNVGI